MLAARGHLRVLEVAVRALQPSRFTWQVGDSMLSKPSLNPERHRLLGTLAADAKLRRVLDKTNWQGMTPLMMAAAAGWGLPAESRNASAMLSIQGKSFAVDGAAVSDCEPAPDASSFPPRACALLLAWTADGSISTLPGSMGLLNSSFPCRCLSPHILALPLGGLLCVALFRR